MRTFTDDELSNLVACPKQVDDPPRREMRVEGKMKRNDMTLKSLDGKHSFRVFMRQSDEFVENFSIGLMYVPGEEPGSFQLIRCNGQHGGNVFTLIMRFSIFIGAWPKISTLEFLNPDSLNNPAPTLRTARH